MLLWGSIKRNFSFLEGQLFPSGFLMVSVRMWHTLILLKAG